MFYCSQLELLTLNCLQVLLRVSFVSKQAIRFGRQVSLLLGRAWSVQSGTSSFLMVLGQNRAFLLLYNEKSGDLVWCYRCQNELLMVLQGNGRTHTLFITWIISNLADLEHVTSPPAAHATLELVLETHKDLSLYQMQMSNCEMLIVTHRSVTCDKGILLGEDNYIITKLLVFCNSNYRVWAIGFYHPSQSVTKTLSWEYLKCVSKISYWNNLSR